MSTVITLVIALFLGSPVALLADDGLKPNIAFIFADDWGWGDLSCHGQEPRTVEELKQRHSR